MQNLGLLCPQTLNPRTLTSLSLNPTRDTVSPKALNPKTLMPSSLNPPAIPLTRLLAQGVAGRNVLQSLKVPELNSPEVPFSHIRDEMMFFERNMGR